MNNDNELNELNPPVMDGYTKIPTFKLWVANRFPYMETDFDGITNYELLEALTNYLNNVIKNEENVESNVAKLNQAYLELFNYVKDYFNNLDVQEEINNKLDDLVADGTLTRLIGAYIQPLIDEQNQEIAEFKAGVNGQIAEQNAQIQAIESGSPLVASNVAGMTDTTRVYVNTTDGKWYYYNGTQWVAGGVYQAIQNADGTITYNMLETSLKSSFSKHTETTNVQITKDKWINDNGAVQTLNGYYIFDINVNPFETYYINEQLYPSGYGANANIYAFYNDNTLISTVKLSTVTITSNKYEDYITIPYNANRLVINSSGGKCYLLKIDKYIINNIHKEQLDTTLQSVFTDQYESVTPTTYITDALLDNTNIVSLVGVSILSLDVNPGEKYIISGKQLYDKNFVIFTTENNTFTRTYNSELYTFNTFMDTIKDTSEHEHRFVNYEFTIPEYCKKLYFNQDNYNPITIKKSTSYKVKVDDTDIANIKDEINPLNNKVLMFVGDSICAASTSGVKGWCNLIQENNPTATVYNYGQDGATIAQNGRDTNDVYTKIQTMYSDHPNADYIIIQGGVNDIWQTIPLGDYIENSNYNGETPYDTTTFSGALEWIFHYALTHFAGKKIGYIVTQKVYGSGSFWNYMERAREICKKWSIPYVDLYNEGDLNFYISSQRQDYSITRVVATGDGCHPNLNGYQILTPKIENWLKYKI